MYPSPPSPSVTINLASMSLNLFRCLADLHHFLWTPRVSDIIWHLSLFVWFTSLSMTVSRSICSLLLFYPLIHCSFVVGSYSHPGMGEASVWAGQPQRTNSCLWACERLWESHCPGSHSATQSPWRWERLFHRRPGFPPGSNPGFSDSAPLASWVGWLCLGSSYPVRWRVFSSIPDRCLLCACPAPSKLWQCPLRHKNHTAPPPALRTASLIWVTPQ